MGKNTQSFEDWKKENVYIKIDNKYHFNDGVIVDQKNIFKKYKIDIS